MRRAVPEVSGIMNVIHARVWAARGLRLTHHPRPRMLTYAAASSFAARPHSKVWGLESRTARLLPANNTNRACFSSESAFRTEGNKIHFFSLGCSRNLVDTEVMLGILLKAGYEVSEVSPRCRPTKNMRDVRF